MMMMMMKLVRLRQLSRAAAVVVPRRTLLQSSDEVNARVARLVHDFRKRGHAHANVNPIGGVAARFEARLFGLRADDVISDRSATSASARTVGELVAQLERVYCSTLALEADHLDDDEADWLARELESDAGSAEPSAAELARFGELLVLSQAFDEYVHKKLRFVKRYGLEGAESLLVAIDVLLAQCVAERIDDVVIGMPHRGRNNLLALLLDYPAASMFAKMRGRSLLPPGVLGTDDVLSHIAQSVELGARYAASAPHGDGSAAQQRLHVSLLHNPSHLEAINPVALGKTRGRQDDAMPSEPRTVASSRERLAWRALRRSARRVGPLCVLMHGDSAAAGQGVVAEAALLARLPGYTTCGSVHVIVNNQVGFTTAGDEARSSRYASDVAKINGSPVLRVNGEDPIAVARAARIAVRFRAHFGSDVWIDLLCYRRHGHNELDEPAFTQPEMYAGISTRATVAQQFAKTLVERGVWRDETARELVRAFEARLDAEYESVTTPQFAPAVSHLQGAAWAKFRQGAALDVAAPLETGVALDTLRRVAEASVALPAGAAAHKRLQKAFIEARRQKFAAGDAIDYASAEAAAFGTLMLEGYNVRLSGQDVQRGTFSHRHVVLNDQKTGERFCPLNLNLQAGERGVGAVEAVNSPLSEFGVMGFEYGYSWQRPDTLTIWEAQYGDFANTAQVIIDQFVASGEHKWLRQSGLVLLLPHGYDGAGPEHSSARIERFLQLSNEPVARDEALAADHMPNFVVVNPSTPASYFHALRRQLHWQFRKPLVVIAPKTLIRLPECTSPLAELGPGSTFRAVLDDALTAEAPRRVTDVVLCSGKLYYELLAARTERHAGDEAGKIALIRVEQLAPFPHQELAFALARYTNVKRVRWAQEEPQNQGAWTFVEPRFNASHANAERGGRLEYVGNGPLAASATGIHAEHLRLQARVIDLAIGGAARSKD